MEWNWQVNNEPGSPEYNMAADAALLTALTENTRGQPTVRVYIWDRPAVSIGRLQKSEPVSTHFPGLPLIRRPTGGRAVLHGEDLTISVVIRLEWLPLENQSVSSSHQFIMSNVERALKATGREVCFGGCPITSQKDIVDCFELAASCDLIDSYSGAKLVGSAQRREGAALLQQMSVPFSVIPDRKMFLTHLKSAFQKTFALLEHNQTNS